MKPKRTKNKQRPFCIQDIKDDWEANGKATIERIQKTFDEITLQYLIDKALRKLER